MIWILWILFPLYGLLSSLFYLPEEQSNLTNAILIASFTGKFDGVDPSILMIFNFLGIIPMIFALVVLFDDQDIPSWPFVVASFVSGAFGLFPYLALRDYGTTFDGQKFSRFQHLLDRRWDSIILLALSLFLLLFGLFEGSFRSYIDAWRTNSLVHVMTFDFIILNLVLPVVIWDDMKRRQAPSWLRTIFWLPIIGPLIHLVFRPSLRQLEITS